MIIGDETHQQESFTSYESSNKFGDLSERSLNFSNVLFSQPSMQMMRSYSNILMNSSGQKPVFSKILNDVTASIGDSVVFEAQVFGVPEPLVTWLWNDDVISNQSSFCYHKTSDFHKLTLDSCKLQHSGTIKCRAVNKFGEVFSSASLTINNRVELEDHKKQQNTLKLRQEISSLASLDDSECESNISSRILTARGEKRKYSKDQSDEVFVEEDAEPLNKIALMEEWSERVRSIIKEEMEKRYPIKDLTTQEETVKGPEFERAIVDCVVEAGQPAHFVYLLKSNSCATVQWYKNGSLLSPVSGSLDIVTDDNDAGCLIISEAEPFHGGIYKCVASNENGSTQAKASLLVKGSSNLQRSSVSNLPQTPQMINKSSQTFADQISQTDEKITKRSAEDDNETTASKIRCLKLKESHQGWLSSL